MGTTKENPRLTAFKEYRETKDQSGTLKRCPICWSLLLDTDINAHAVWHDKLRRAVDERDTLG